MVWNFQTRQLFTDSGVPIKKVHCPFSVSSSDLRDSEDLKLSCDRCSHQIVDTESLTDEEVVELLQENPNTCLKINLNDKRIRIHSNGKIIRK